MNLRTFTLFLLLLLGHIVSAQEATPAVAEPAPAPAPEGSTAVAPEIVEPKRVLVAALGALGSEEYLEDWKSTATDIRAAAEADSAVELHLLGEADGFKGATREDLLEALKAPAPEDELWLFLCGHGTWDGRVGKFNLRGPDISDVELAEALKDRKGTVVIVLACSSSAPFMRTLSEEGRIIVTATKSGNELNYTRFGRFFAKALSSEEADLDEDGQTSVLESFLQASTDVAEFYQIENRLATEHSMIDDSGDRLGTRADWFRGVRAIKVPKDKAAADGPRAHQLHLVPSELERQLTLAERTTRNDLERKIFVLREKKSKIEPAKYYQELEALLLEVGEIYALAEERLEAQN